MSDLPTELKYTRNHEWVRLNDDGTVTVGITDHAQEQLGDLVYVECPEVGSGYTAEEACAVVESVKAASDIYAPVAGEIVEINSALEDSPETINESAYEGGWIFKLRPRDSSALGGLLDDAGYAELLETEE
ncbi:MAG: glycine cleavage system protein GcvH [Gammaproteobacteria bacterium]